MGDIRLVLMAKRNFRSAAFFAIAIGERYIHNEKKT